MRQNTEHVQSLRPLNSYSLGKKYKYQKIKKREKKGMRHREMKINKIEPDVVTNKDH